MPNRIIRAGINSSDRVNQLDYAEEVFYRRLFSAIDDYGLFDARPSILRAHLYPLRIDRVREADISRWLAACEKAGLILLYEAESKPYLWVLDTQWTGRAEPKFPLPPGTELIQTGKNSYQLKSSANNCTQLRADENNCKQLRPYSYSDSLSKTDSENSRGSAEQSPIMTALEDLYPGSATNFGAIRPMFDLVEKLGATAEQVKAFPSWMAEKHPRKANTPFAFRDLFPESLRGDAALSIAPAQKYNCDRCKDRFMYTLNGKTQQCDCWEKKKEAA